MSRILILVEGPTESNFIERQLTPYLAAKGLYFETPIIVPTKIVPGQPYYKGGNSYSKVKKALQNLLNDSNAAAITTMFDFYGLPEDFSGYQQQSGKCFDRVCQLEEAFKAEIRDRRFIPYFSLHEFEALLFVSPEIIARRFPDNDYLNELNRIKGQFSSPEEINNDPETAPSKRLEKLTEKKYKKVLDGGAIIEQIGIDRIRAECRHFHQWLERLESLSTQ